MMGTALVGLILLISPLALGFPVLGILLYQWVDLLAPDKLIWHHLTGMPLSMVLGVSTILGFVVSWRERVFNRSVLQWFLIAYAIWITVTTVYAMVPEHAWWKWDRTIKVLLATFLLAIAMNSRKRIELALWVFVVPIVIYAARGALLTIQIGGSGELVTGADGSFLADRTTLATCQAAAIPVLVFLSRESLLIPRTALTRMAMWGAIAACALSIVGTASRGGMLAAAVAFAVMVVRSDRKLVGLVGVALLVGLALLIAPDEWFNRMATIKTYDQDDSSASRIGSWNFAMDVARRSPWVGGGFAVFRLNQFRLSNGDILVGRWNDSHSWFFETLGEQGYIGVALLLFMVLASAYYLLRTDLAFAKNAERRWEALAGRYCLAGLFGMISGGLFVGIGCYQPFYVFPVIAAGLAHLYASREHGASHDVTVNRGFLTAAKAMASGRPREYPTMHRPRGAGRTLG